MLVGSSAESQYARERQAPGKHAVQDDAERIEVGTVVDRPVHAARLFRRDVREFARIRQRTRQPGRRAIGSGATRIDQADGFHIGRHQDIDRLDVVMDDMRCVQYFQDACELTGNRQAGRDIQTLSL